MKKLLLIPFILNFQLLLAQETVHPALEQISTPFKYLTEGSFNQQNFLFSKSWVKARILAADNSIISNDSFLFNFDKIDHKLLITRDFIRVFEVDRREFKAVLFYWRDSAYIFKHISFINDKDLFEVIVNDNGGYSLYKVTHTKLVKGHYGASTYGSSGPSASDLYIDAAEYVIFFPNREYRKIHLLKRMAIERAFKLHPDSEKVTSYLNMLNGNDYNERDLIKLIAYLNKPTDFLPAN